MKHKGLVCPVCDMPYRGGPNSTMCPECLKNMHRFGSFPINKEERKRQFAGYR